MKTDANIIKAFTEMSVKYEKIVDNELNLFWGWSYQGFVDKLFENTPIQKDDIVLDVATGTGIISKRLETEGLSRSRIHGLDITMSMLKHAKIRFASQLQDDNVNLVCASAMEMPYSNSTFTKVICGLASHHMKAKIFVSESFRVLSPGGKLSIIDAGGSKFWKIPGLKFVIKLAAYIYFALVENNSRAWIEADAVYNVLSTEDWKDLLIISGFENISIQRLSSKHFWIPAPLMINADKNNGGF